MRLHCVHALAHAACGPKLEARCWALWGQRAGGWSHTCCMLSTAHTHFVIWCHHLGKTVSLPLLTVCAACCSLHLQSLVVVDKDESGRLSQSEVFGVRYVPLTTAQHQLHDDRPAK